MNGYDCYFMRFTSVTVRRNIACQTICVYALTESQSTGFRLGAYDERMHENEIYRIEKVILFKRNSVTVDVMNFKWLYLESKNMWHVLLTTNIMTVVIVYT